MLLFCLYCYAGVTIEGVGVYIDFVSFAQGQGLLKRCRSEIGKKVGLCMKARKEVDEYRRYRCCCQIYTCNLTDQNYDQSPIRITTRDNI